MTRFLALILAVSIQSVSANGPALQVVASTGPEAAPATVIVKDSSLQSPLQEGVNTFVIKLSSATLLDGVTFVNETATATGHLQISVSDELLPASSKDWVQVDGAIPFHGKRLFNLSMVGVNARYLKLSFRVDKAGQIARL